MTPARRAFLWGFFLWLGFGILIWILHLTKPESGSVTFNGEEVTGLPAFAVAVGIGGFFGVFFGLILAGIARLLGGRPP